MRRKFAKILGAVALIAALGAGLAGTAIACGGTGCYTYEGAGGIRYCHCY